MSADIARFQRSVSTLSRRVMLGELSRQTSPPRVIEIGGGYGSLCIIPLTKSSSGVSIFSLTCLKHCCSRRPYLALHAPTKRLYLYDPADRLDAAKLAELDFVLLPDYRLDALTGFEFDLAINVASMQEMRVDQIERYPSTLSS